MIEFGKIISVSEPELSTILDEINANSLMPKLVMDTNFRYSIGNPKIHSLNTDDLIRFAIGHPLIVELILKGRRLKVGDANNFICKLKSLKLIGFLVRNRSNCDRILNEIKDGWKSTFPFDYYEGIHIELYR